MSLLHILYVTRVSPYSLAIDNLFEVFNEATTLIVLTCSMRYADSPFTPEVSSSMGFALIGVILFNIALNMGYFLVEQGRFVWVKIKEVKCVRDRLKGESSTVAIKPEIHKESDSIYHQE